MKPRVEGVKPIVADVTSERRPARHGAIELTGRREIPTSRAFQTPPWIGGGGGGPSVTNLAPNVIFKLCLIPD